MIQKRTRLSLRALATCATARGLRIAAGGMTGFALTWAGLMGFFVAVFIADSKGRPRCSGPVNQKDNSTTRLVKLARLPATSEPSETEKRTSCGCENAPVLPGHDLR